MANFYIQPSSIQGSLKVPSSKSHTTRAILFAALAKGMSKVDHYLPSPDTNAMIKAVRQLGAEVKIGPSTLEIQGCGGQFQAGAREIDCGNSGQVLRFIGALSALSPYQTTFTGDKSIRQNRPIGPLADGLNQLGALATSNNAPLEVKGPLIKGSATIDGEDSQPVSGLIMAGAFAPHPVEIHVTNPGEKPWIELTLHWLRRLGIAYERKDYSYYRLQGGTQLEGFHYSVPGDFSTAAFPIVAALLTHSELTLENIDMDDPQGDKAIIPILEKMGALFSIRDKSLTIHRSGPLKGMKIDVNDCIDALPILAVVGCFAEGTTEIFNGAIARKKESDRISAIATELKKMGADIEERPDGLVINPSLLHGAELNTFSDHRIALSLSVAAMAASSPSTINGAECTLKTYPNFYEDFRAIGAKIER